MNPSSDKAIRALERGLQVFQLLDNSTGSSLQQLHAATGMAKPTLLRILHTLEANGFAWRALGDGLYRRKIWVQEPQVGSAKLSTLGAIAGPFLERMQSKAIWPSDLLVMHRHRLIAVETARRRSGLQVDFYPLGTQVDVILSAPGRAYLAWSTPAEVARVLAFYQRQAHPNPRALRMLQHELPALLETFRRDGYAWRDPLWGGSHLPMSEFDDGLDAIAVPVMKGPQVLACLNLVWVRKYALREKLVGEHLEALKATALDIADAAAAVMGSHRSHPR